MYECWSWTIKYTEHWRIDAFKLWCWRRLLRVPWTTRRSNQSILKEINPEYSLEGLMLKFPSFGHPMKRADSLEKTLMLGKIEGRRRRGWQRMRWLGRIINSMDMSLSKVWEWRAGKPGVLQSIGLQRVGHNLATEQQQQQQQQQRRRSQRQRKRPWEAGIGLVWPLAKECQQPLGGKKEKNKFFSWASRNDQILLTLWFRPHEAHLALLISRSVNDTSVLF